ncbi:MAG TPA: tetratricopeptide repeat protein [Bryobacteraceae bacterium]|nr:tetratricopeptide repeat protein [Bryobacteraceae bacterium]
MVICTACALLALAQQHVPSAPQLALFSVDALYRQGTALFQSGKYAEAAELFEQASRAAPSDARVWKALGASRAAMGDYQRADEPFQQACKLDPALEDACYFYGRNLYALNRFEPALEVLRNILPRDRAPWRVYLGIAQASEALGRAKQAESAFQQAQRLYELLPANERGRPDFDPRLHYAVFLFRQGRLNDALPMAQVVTTAWPGFGRGHFEVGRILHHQGQLAPAAEELEKAVKGGAGPPAHLLLGRVYLRLGRAAEGEHHLKLGAEAR